MQQLIRKYGVAFFILVMAIASLSHYWKIGRDNQVLRADGKGYYAYLPAIFIYHDNQMNFLYYYESKYDFHVDFAEFRAYQNGKYLDKYYAGLAILQLPFFLAAHSISNICGLPTDGYAPLYQHFFIMGELFYLFLGMQALMYFLIALNIKPLHAWMAIGLILFGTNCYHYAVYEQCMTHAYNLSLMCIFILGVQKVFRYRSRKWILVSFITIGLIVILRPTNLLIILFIPFIAGSWKELKSGFIFIFQKPYYLVAGVILASLPVLIQCGLWYWQTGHFYAYSYGKEVMEWANPKMYHILFSYRSGWFLWSPLAFIGIGLLFFLYQNIFRLISVFLFTFIVVYVISCWWTPDYGWRFGSRVFIDYLFVVAIGFGMAFTKIRSVYLKISLVVICVIGVFVNQVQAYQYRKEIILWDNMNKDLYWRVFLETSKGYDHWLGEKISFGHQELIENNIDKSFYNGFEQPGTWPGDDHTTNLVARRGEYSYVLDQDHLFSPAFNLKFTGDILKNDSMIQESVWFIGPHPEDTRLAVQINHGGKMIFWNDMMFRRFVTNDGEWTRAVFHVPIPSNILPGDSLRCFVYNGQSQTRFFLDDFRIDLIKK